MVLVGALWGCTNPLLRQGVVDSQPSHQEGRDTAKRPSLSATPKHNGLVSTIFQFLSKLKNVRVWLPYLINQSGSLLYYVTLAQSNLSLAVPICNALALVFSILTSVLLGERIHKPLQTVVGAALVVAGVTLCLNSAENPQQDESDTLAATTSEEL